MTADRDHEIPRYYQGGLLGEPDERWNLGDPGRSWDVLSGGIANLTYEMKPGLVRLESAPPWANADQNRKELTMTTNPHEDVVTILARALYAGATTSWIPARIRLWMWNHDITSHTVKARFENIAAEVLRETFNYEEPNA